MLLPHLLLASSRMQHKIRVASNSRTSYRLVKISHGLKVQKKSCTNTHTHTHNTPVFKSVLEIAESDYYLHHVCPSVRLSVCNNSVPTWRIVMKFNILLFFENLSRKVKVSLKSYKNNFEWKTTHIFYHISFSYSYNEKCFRQKLQSKSEHKFYVQ